MNNGLGRWDSCLGVYRLTKSKAVNMSIAEYYHCAPIYYHSTAIYEKKANC